ncbi:MAG: acyltransferase [Burkholderiales bacterium]|nr:acyltransferase [Burkholderiales bacterium]MDE1925767.1 acyltransferase [Burkholderiales bacterium]MDE2158009.1 acyltransferase [Burkholderiales bacterium]
MKEIKALTSLRGIAALAVVMQHFSRTAQDHCPSVIPSLVPHGYLAVDFFFVLSGYIMCYTYLSKFKQGGWSAYGPFLQRRAIRLLPLNAFITLALLLAGWLSIGATGTNMFFGELRYPIDIVTNLLMLQGLGLGHNMNAPSWSVSAELMAYVTFPLLIYAVFSRRRVVVGLALLAALALLLKIALASPRLGLAADDPVGGAMRCFSEFTLGMLVYRWTGDQSWAQRLGGDRVTAALLAASVLLLLLRIDLFIALSFPLVVGAVSCNRGRVATLLSHPALHLLGQISYSLYLIHNAFRPIATLILVTLHPAPLNMAGALLFAFVASLAVLPFAWLTYRWIEQPSRTFLQRRLFARASSSGTA